MEWALDLTSGEKQSRKKGQIKVVVNRRKCIQFCADGRIKGQVCNLEQIHSLGFLVSDIGQ